MLTDVLNPIFNPILIPIGNYLRPETKIDGRLSDLQDKLSNFSRKKTIENPVLRAQIRQLSRDLGALNLTRNFLPSQKDREKTLNLANGIIDFVEDQILPFLANVDAQINSNLTNKSHPGINQVAADKIYAQSAEILDEISELKSQSEKLPSLWKDTAWKNLALLVGMAILCTLGQTVTVLTVGVGALWLLYEVHYNYKKDIFDKANGLLDNLVAHDNKIRQNVTEHRATYNNYQNQVLAKKWETLLCYFQTLANNPYMVENPGHLSMELELELD